MHCLKCGKKTDEEQSFCQACLEAMEAYPIKSDVHIQLPNRGKPAAPKKAARKRRPASAEEQMASLRKISRWLTILCVILLLLLAVCVALLLQYRFTKGGLTLPDAPLFHVKQFGR